MQSLFGVEYNYKCSPYHKSKDVQGIELNWLKHWFFILQTQIQFPIGTSKRISNCDSWSSIVGKVVYK